MNTPRGFLGAAVLFWGWQTGIWLVAVPVALLIEFARVSPRRWDFATLDFQRAADLCTAIVLAIGVVLYAVFGNPAAIKLWFQWLAVMLLPLALLQAYGTARDVEVSVLFRSMRRMPLHRVPRFNLAYPYAAIWLLGASAASTRSPTFYVGASLLACWALWAIRPARLHGASRYAWPALIALAVGVGYAGHIGLSELQVWLEANVPEWLVGSGDRTDPHESRTDIGRLGEIKSSSAIVMRVQTGRPFPQGLLLHRASYNDYIGSTWVARTSAFSVVPRAGESSWQLVPGGASSAQIVIDERSARGNPLLGLPAGATRIDGLSAVELRRNPLGAVQAELAAGSFRYVVGYDASAMAPDQPASSILEDLEAAPDERDRKIPRMESTAVQELARTLHLADAGPDAAMRRISAHFLSEFRYALYQPHHPDRRSPLEHFLIESRQGHCEYFATATVMLLRAAGIPARYATGFSVQEYSARENAYLVRQRHAHAWARAWVDGRWVDLDTTPPEWFAAEAAQDSAWTSLADLGSWLRHRWGRMMEESDRSDGTLLLVLAALALVAWFAWRLMRGRQGVRRTAALHTAPGTARPGADSSFYRVETRLAELGWPRAASESMSDWLTRIAHEDAQVLDAGASRRALELHYRYRFDPLGIDAAERRALDESVTRLLAGVDQWAATRSAAGAGIRSSAR